MNPPSFKYSLEYSPFTNSFDQQYGDEDKNCQSPSAILILKYKISATDSNIIISKWLNNHPHESRQTLCQLLQSKKVVFEDGKLIDSPQLFANEAQLLVYTIQENKTLKLKDRWYRLSFYAQCFTGSALINWLVRNNNNLPEEAIAIGQSLLEHGLIEDICQKHKFAPNGCLYRFNT